MVREWRAGLEGVGEIGSVSTGLRGVVLVLLAALVSLILISAVVFSCADGASTKDKASAAQTDTYGGTACAAGCGAACGG